MKQDFKIGPLEAKIASALQRDASISVGELAELLELRETVVSQHLALMRKDGLVAARRDGRTIHYSLCGDAPRRVLETLYAIYCSSADDTTGPADGH